MSSIHNVGGNSPVYGINKTNPKPATTAAPGTTASTSARGADKLELSGAGHLLEALKAGGDVRTSKVAEIKAQILSGKYEDPQKLDIATDRLLDDLLK